MQKQTLSNLRSYGRGQETDLEVLSAAIGSRSIAEAWLRSCGNLAGVASASVETLRVTALSANADVEQPLSRLLAIHSYGVRALGQRAAARPTIGAFNTMTTYLRAVMQGEGVEQFRVLYLDTKNRLILDEVLGLGTVDHAPVYPREVIRRALELSANAMIVAHNHPSGDPHPSHSDVEMTAKLVAAAEAMDIKVHDHVIVGRHGVASLSQMGLMRGWRPKRQTKCPCTCRPG